MSQAASTQEMQQKIAELEKKLAASRKNELDLLDQIHFFKTLLLQSPFPIQVHQTDGTLCMVNQAWEDLWGVKSEEAVGKLNILHDRHFKKCGLQNAAMRALSGESVLLPDMQVSPSHSQCPGKVHWARPLVYSINDDQNETSHIVVCQKECTELKESEERYNIIVENANEAIMVFQDGLIKFFNQKALAIGGYEAMDYQDQPFLNFVPEDFHDLLMERHRKRMAGEDVPNFYQTKILHKSGEELWLQMNVIRTDWEDKPASLAFLFDITDHKRAQEKIEDHRDQLERIVAERTEELSLTNDYLKREIYERIRKEQALKESELKFRTLFNLSPQAVTLTDLETGSFVDVNEKFCELTQFQRDEIIGQTTIGAGFYSPEIRNAIINELKLHGIINGMEIEATIKDGSQRTGLLYAKLIEVGGNKLIFAEISDMTERRHLEEQLLQARKMEAIGTLAAGIAHDFNNILHIIFGHTHMLERSRFDEETVADHIEGITSAARRASKLVRQILTFSRQASQKLGPLSLKPFIKQTIKDIKTTIPEHISIIEKIDCERDLINGDATQVNQVLSNLINNAVQAMENEEGTLTISLAEASDTEIICGESDIDGPFLRLTISDTGHGMPQHISERVFEPYFTTKERTEGLGLGLAIVHGIVKTHKGAITLSSSPGKGTTFNVFLPLTEPEEPCRSSVDRKPAAPAVHPNRKILFIDDEIIAVQIWEIALSQNGYTVMGYTSATDALENFRSTPQQFDIVITDQKMPGMSGTDLAQELFKIRKDIPVIVASGWNDTADQEMGKKIGIRAYIDKPHELDDLIDLIEQTLAETTTH